MTTSTLQLDNPIWDALTGRQADMSYGNDRARRYPQGRGFARALVYAISKEINQRGHVPLLHVRSDNFAAIRSYEALGYKHRRTMNFAVVTRQPI